MLTNTDSWNQSSEVVAVIKSDYVVLKPVELFCGKNMEDFGRGLEKA
jgi:hypothetical protein